MDHHCPWLNTCVCFKNYKCYLLVLFYSLALCMYTFVSIFPYYISFLSGDNNLGVSHQITKYTIFNILFLFVISGLFMMPVLCMLHDHVKLIACNQTTIGSLFIQNLIFIKLFYNFNIHLNV